MTDALPPMQMGSVALFFLVNLLLTNLTEILAQRGKEDNCYINDSGFVCCSKILEDTMKSAMDGGDLTSSANKIQMMAKNVLGGRFEIVVAMDDFAHKNHFKDGKICKVEKNGQYALAWQS